MESPPVYQLQRFNDGPFLLFGHAFLFAGTLVAFSNLSEDFGFGNLLLSSVWILGYFGLWYLNIKRDGGAVVTAVQFFEHFGWERMLRVESGGSILWVGYRVSGRDVTVLKVSGVREVTWTPGQASCMTNSDLDDWLVHLELETSDVALYRRRRFQVDRRERFLLFSSMKRDEAGDEATKLQSFLARNGVQVPLKPPLDDVIERIFNKKYKLG